MKNLHAALGCLAIVPMTCSAMASPNSHPLVDAFPQSTVFHQSSKHYEQVDLVAGPVDYLKGDNEGYQASLTIEALGESSIWINDHGSSDSAVHLYQEMLGQLEEKQFEILYRCAQSQCGDLTGWQLYLSERLAGNETSQHYVLAKQEGSNGNQWLVQFYAIDLDGEPRSYLRILNASDRPALKLAFNQHLLSIQDDYPEVASLDHIPAILFETGKAELSQSATEYLNRLKGEIRAAGVSHLTISGHSDSVGAEISNLSLSLERAKTVVGVLQKDPDLLGLTLDIEHHGESKPVANNDSPEGREQNRRVSIGYRPPLETTSLN